MRVVAAAQAKRRPARRRRRSTPPDCPPPKIPKPLGGHHLLVCAWVGWTACNAVSGTGQQCILMTCKASHRQYTASHIRRPAAFIPALLCDYERLYHKSLVKYSCSTGEHMTAFSTASNSWNRVLTRTWRLMLWSLRRVSLGLATSVRYGKMDVQSCVTRENQAGRTSYLCVVIHLAGPGFDCGCLSVSRMRFIYVARLLGQSSQPECTRNQDWRRGLASDSHRLPRLEHAILHVLHNRLFKASQASLCHSSEPVPKIISGTPNAGTP